METAKDLIEQLNAIDEISRIETKRGRTINLSEIAAVIGRGDKYIPYNYVKPLREKRKLAYTFPDMPNHPEQAYTINN